MSTSEIKEDSEDINTRLLISNRQVGSIIGKKGERIQQVREQCGNPFFMSVLKPETRVVQERILAIRGSIAQIAKAIQLVANLILQGVSGKDIKPSNSDSLAICFLVQKFVVGSIIGKSGSMIQGIQTETDTKIQISTDALPNSSEKTVTVTGTPTAIHEATIRILTQLKANPLRPGTRVERYRPGMPGVGSFGGGQQGQQLGSQLGSQLGGGPFMGGGGQQQPFYGLPPTYGSSAQTPQVNSTQKIAIPTVCAGTVIGRGGTVIRDLRARTGCNISISDADDSTPNERVVILTGTSQGIQAAIYLIRQLVEQYTPQDY